MTTESMNIVQGSLFEEDYLVRTLGDLSHRNDVALTELVANAWDAGAAKVTISIPEERGQLLVFVVGDTISDKIVGEHKLGDHGYVYVTTYSQLVDTARRRLFNLRDRLGKRYEAISGLELAEKQKEMNLD